VPHAVEPAGLDERLDRSLVEDVDVDAFAEIVEVAEGAVGLAFFDDQRDEPFADVADRGDPNTICGRHR